MAWLDMLHLPQLIQDLGVILIVAAIVTLLFKKLRQPVVLGYLIAGFLVGPHVPFVPNVLDTENIKVLAEIGVIFLLFGLGLEFSFKKLVQVGKSASITALFEIIFMLGAGFLAGQVLGWTKMDSLFLGGILSVSSTTIIVRAFEELGLKGQRFVSLVFGVLIVEDLVAILLLVLLSSVAISQSFSGGELMLSSLRLIFFLVLWFIVGIYLLPGFLRLAREHLSDETMLIVSIALCLLMVIVATQVGFSPALGAFVMGSLIAETREGHRVEQLIIPVRDLFAAVFFVSVGMLIDPRILFEHFGVIILMSVITIIGKLLSTSLGALLSGRSLKTSIQTGMSLAQIGEFSFIIATLGLTLKVTSDFLYPIAVAVSAVTTFTTPYLIKYSEATFNFVEAKLPAPLKHRLAGYEAAMARGSAHNIWQIVWTEYGTKILLNSVVVIALSLTVSRVLIPKFFDSLASASQMVNALICLILLLACGPFLWAIVVAPPKNLEDYGGETVRQIRRLQFGLSFLRLLIGVLLTSFVIFQFTSMSATVGVVLLALSIIGVYFSRHAEPLYQAVETRFLANLSDRQRYELEIRPTRPELAPWNASFAEFVISPDSQLVGQRLSEMAVKEKYGVTIAMIERGARRILAPGREEMLMPYDRVALIGTDEQLGHIRSIIEITAAPISRELADLFGLDSIFLHSNHPCNGKSIRDCGMRESVGGLIVGVERGDQRILNPDSSLILQPLDFIWVVGDLAKLRVFKKNNGLIDEASV